MKNGEFGRSKIHVDIVLISGKQGSGKSTLARAIRAKVQALNIPEWVVEEAIFAGPIYLMHHYCRKILVDRGITPPHEKKDGYLLQLLGTEWGRNKIGEDVWARALRGEIEKEIAYYENGSNVSRITFVVPDTRFENEFDMFPEALKVRLECREGLRRQRAEMWRDTSSHASETGLDKYAAEGKFDHVFNTESYFADDMAATIVRSILKRSNDA